MHTSHERCPGVYGLAFLRKDHLILGLGLSSFSQTYWERVVLLFFSFGAEALGVAIISNFEFPASAANV